MMYAARLSAGIIAFSMLLAMPFFAFAQGQAAAAGGDLKATIRAAIAADPRAAGMPQRQIDAMVEALTAEAAAQGVASHDILWRPTVPAPSASAAAQGRLARIPLFTTCGDSTSLLCALNHALGFDGSALIIPLVLGAVALVAIVIIALLIAHHRREVVIKPPPPLF